MIDSTIASPARLITAFGTVLYVDIATGELRHGPVETCPKNALFVGDPNVDGRLRRGHLALDLGDARKPIICGAEGCRTGTRAGAGAAATLLEATPLERGLVALATDGFFLSAIPDGRVSLSARVCSTWELFLASGAWCSEPAATGDESFLGDESFAKVGRLNFYKQRIKYYVVSPLMRVQRTPNREPIRS